MPCKIKVFGHNFLLGDLRLAVEDYSPAKRRYSPTYYDSDLSDDQWGRVKPLLPEYLRGPRVNPHDARALMNGISYWFQNDVALRKVPEDLPPWGQIHWTAHNIVAAGAMEKIAEAMADDQFKAGMDKRLESLRGNPRKRGGGLKVLGHPHRLKS